MKNARLTLIAALTQFSSHVNSHSVHRFLATHTLATASPLANYTHCSLQLQLIWNSWRSGNPFDSRLDCSPRCFYMHFDCCSFAARSLFFFFACFFMVVLRLPLLLLLPSGLVFYVVNVLRYARLTGKGKADFLAEPARPGTRTD